VDSFVKTLDDKSSVLDIGAGYGAISKAAIKSGAKVVSNDLALEHLLWLRGQVDVEEKTRLYLNTGRFPDLDNATESLTHISAHDVATHLPEQLHALPDKLHVFTPDKLADEVTKAGFTITQSNFISLQQFGKSDEGRDGKEAVGFIAFKVPDPAASTRV
jgi:SAM-dependent methyltransferase